MGRATLRKDEIDSSPTPPKRAEERSHLLAGLESASDSLQAPFKPLPCLYCYLIWVRQMQLRAHSFFFFFSAKRQPALPKRQALKFGELMLLPIRRRHSCA